MIRKRKRLWAMLLSAALIVTQLPAVAIAENNAPEDGSIASFEELPSGVAEQTVPVGTELSGLTLPDTVTATVYHVTEDTVISDEDESGDSSTATPSDAKESISENGSKDSSIKDSGETVTTVTTSTEEIPVTWGDGVPAYNGDTEGKYVFTADVGGYALSDNAKLPQITVTVSADTAENPTENPSTEPIPCTKTEGCTLEDGHEGECVTAPPTNDAFVKTITGWTFVDDGDLNKGELSMPGVSADNQADFDTAVSMLPTQISADIDGEADKVPVDITGWTCAEYTRDKDGNWPLAGDFTFTAALPAGYACDPAPTVRVTPGGGDVFDFGGLTISGTPTATQEADGQIKLTQNGDYEISGTWSGTLDGVDRNNKKAVITVSSGVTANVTLNGATITKVSGTDYACAFAVANGGTANITLSGTNTLTSGGYRAGLEVPDGANLTIDGSGSLTATGGFSGAGVGGGLDGAGGTINITGGTVNATGGSNGAGIGGGSNGAGGAIRITGGTVTATSGDNGAGIGGGSNGAGGAINITGGTVTANGGGTGNAGGAGIGGGAGGSSGDITIGGRAEVTATGGSELTIRKNDVSNGTIRIGGNAVVNATGGSAGAGIGGGGDRGGAGIGGGAGTSTRNNGRVEISGHAVVNASGGSAGAGIGGGFFGADIGGTITITITINGGTVNATGGSSGAGIGGGYKGDGGDVAISGPDTKVTASGNNGGSDVGSGDGNSNGGSLSVTDNATLEMKGNSTNATDPEYKDCIIIDKDGKGTVYDSAGIGTSVTLWDGQSDKSASGLGVSDGGTIVITGSNTGGGATLTIDVAGVTVTSGGNAVSGVCIRVANNINALTVKDLNLTAQDGKTAIYFPAATLTAEGTCAITGGASDGGRDDAISCSSDLAVEVGDAALTVTGGENRTAYEAGYGIWSSGSLTVNVGSRGSLTARGGNSAEYGGLGMYGSSSVTVHNDGVVLVEGGQADGALSGNGITSGGGVTLTGSGKTTASGYYGIQLSGVLTADGTADVEGRYWGVLFTNGSGYKLVGGGSLEVSRNDHIGVGANDDLELAFTGRLTVHGGSVAGESGIWVKGDLTVSQPPASLDVRSSVDGSYAIYVGGTFTNETSIPIKVNNVKPVLWPAYIVTYQAPDKTGGDVPEWDVYRAGDTATVSGNTGGLSRNGYALSGWKRSDNGTTYTEGQTFPMPANNVTLTAQWTKQGLPQAATPVAAPAGGAYSAAQTVTLTSATSGATIYYTLDGSDPAASGTRQIYSAPFTVPLDTTLKACATALGYTDSAVLTEVYTKKSSSGGSSGGGGGSNSTYKPQSSYTVVGERISQTIPRSDLSLLANDRKNLTLRCDKASMTFDPAALKAILAAVPSTAGSITFAAAPADLSAFPDAAKQIGAHPVYDSTISYKDGNGNLVTVPVNFPAGSAAITLSYAPAAAEVTGSLFMVYVDGKGAVTWLDKSSYDNGRVLAEVPHFSTYGVAYKAPAPVFTDISGHWAKQDIEFVAARGLLSGTGNNQFSPDGTMTRGMFATALGRLAGVNPDSYQTRSFTDVKADAYYAAYVEWAAQKNIAGGTGEKLFSPDAPVTREQMAVMMVNYAGQMGYSIPTPLAAVTFADSDKISAWAAKEVAAMQRAGIVRGKDGNRFDPQANATRAEVSVVLRRFVEVVIDPATATGWVKNDSGHWLYYKGGTALTGWQTISRLRYFFNSDGVMHEGRKQDEANGKWYYWTNAGAATGWREIDGKWYYFDENGVMAVNTKIDGYEVGPDGARKGV